jgi:hypothetical protein
MRKLMVVLLLLLATWGAVSWWHRRPVHAPPGVLAAGAPVQVDLPAGSARLQQGDFTLDARAHFDITARVLSREDYSSDAISSLSPVDLAMGWGRMSDSDVLSHIDISQSARFYYWHTKAFPIPREEIEQSSANMHMIPSDRSIDRQLHDVHPGQVIHIEGFLVDISRKDGWHWNTSLTRDDVGAGACEVIYIESLSTVSEH